MESRKRRICTSNVYPPSPLRDPPPSSIFRDISNYKTPKNRSKTSTLQAASPQFFTATKNTPFSSSHLGFKSSALKSKAARRLKAFELEQSRSARKVQSEKEKSVKSLARSLSVWLNFLFENPISCGCDPENVTGESDWLGLNLGGETKEVLLNNGKRESGPRSKVGIDGPWRASKRQRDLCWRTEGSEELGKGDFSNVKFSGLRASLQEICSFEDLKERMRMYLSLGNCKEIFETMAQVTKNIDEGRIRMRASCPIVSDVAIKERALGILMSYNPSWLRIGLYMILGGDSLLPNGDVSSEHENTFLRMVIEKQFFSHCGLAKAHAYNKLVDGLYRPGYYEKLGNVILKRFLVLVIMLDRAKSQTSLPLKYGIDGKDGGSPLLFSLKSNIKSSRQIISDFLSSDVMHGEGNILAHLVIVGYKVTYQQNPLIEYSFKVTDLFEDLRDGIRLCRATQLLKHDSSILMKVMVPSDTQKKSLVNCGIALQYLQQAGVPLLDEDGMEIIGEDIVNGDKELTLSLLWNMFIHLQVPLLINKTLLLEEISNVQGVVMENSSNQTLLDLLLSWIKAICQIYELRIDSHSSLLDGKALWCLLDYYFRKEHDCSCSFQDPDGTNKEISIMSAIEYTDAVHNFILSQKLTSLLGNFPEVLQVSDILEHNGACNGRSVIVLLVFLAVQLLVKRNLDKLNFHKLLGFGCQNPISRRLSAEWNNEKDPTRDFKAIMAWWQDMAQQNGKGSLNPAPLFSGRNDSSVQRENAAIIIQSHYRRLKACRSYRRIINGAVVLQSAVRAWLSVRNKTFVEPRASFRGMHTKKYSMYSKFMVDRYYFVNLKKSVRIIQQAWKDYIHRKHALRIQHSSATKIQSYYRGWLMRKSFSNVKWAIMTIQRSLRCARIRKDLHVYREEQLSAVVVQSHVRGWMQRRQAKRDLEHLQMRAAIKIQCSWKDYSNNKKLCIQHSAATKIQSHYHGWVTRKNFAFMKQAIMTIQRSLRCARIRKDFQIHREKQLSANIIQSHVRGWMARRQAKRILDHLKTTAAIKIQHSWKHYILKKRMRIQHSAATKIQSHNRGWLTRKNFAYSKRAIRIIQRSFRCSRSRRDFQIQKEQHLSAIVIQSHFRGLLARKRAHREKNLLLSLQSFCRGWLQRKDTKIRNSSAITIQTAFRCMNCRQEFYAGRHAAIEIQRFIRGENARRQFLGALSTRPLSNHGHHGLNISPQSVVKLQRWWRCVLKERTKSAVIIQSHYRGWAARKLARREKQLIVMIQSYWKGYLARKDAKEQLRDLRLRMQKTAANIDDNMRLINRLVAAVKELLSVRSLSGILHTCATLNMATELSQKCCEELVAAGAIGTLLKLIRSVSRSIPDQQILKHALSTLRNLARYPHLAEILVACQGSVETVVLEFLRNKEEGYFIAAELLKRMCACESGAKAIKTPALLKRLNNLAEELARKAGNDKRNTKDTTARENAERRLKEVITLRKIITNGNTTTKV